MFGFFKKLLSRRDAVTQDIVRLLEEEELRCCALSDEELLALPDEELLSTVWVRVRKRADKFDTERRALDNMEEEPRIFYIVYYYDQKVNAEGLCSYFANTSRETALFLREALARIGAEEHKALFEDFLHDNKVATAALSAFAIGNSREFKKLERQYPFDDFNSAFYALPPMTEALAAYVRENISVF
ncbi:MAG: DUF4375 domain-containing protein [Ruminococcaceae bacterium]|nr:DUF4375 domain-containing protein [Oscillospiraceae bacterium]